MLSSLPIGPVGPDRAQATEQHHGDLAGKYSAARSPQISPAAFEHRARAMDSAVPVDAKNASTSDLENRTDSGFPQRPQPSLLSTKHERRYHHPV